MLISPTEPAAIKSLGLVSSIPERHGADILWGSSRWKLCGVQRKELGDFVASVEDGRLAKEVAQMKSLGFAAVIIEGQPKWTTEGYLAGMDRWLNRWTRTAHISMVMSLQDRGLRVIATRDIYDTVAAVEVLMGWCEKERHDALDRRPKPSRNEWGEHTNADFQLHVLQSIPGVGVGQAKAILAHFGRLPIEWSVAEAELLAIKGIGPRKVEAMTKAIPLRKVTDVADVGVDVGVTATRA